MEEHTILQNISLGSDRRILRVERKDLAFLPGQYIHVGLAGQKLSREYSIYSAPQQDFLEILYKEIPQGALTPSLSQLRTGDRVNLEGPFGEFLIDQDMFHQRILFISTGTGISPFHCFHLSYPRLDYQLLHGVSRYQDGFDKECFPQGRYISCVSREGGGNFQGRVSKWIEEQDISSFKHFMICGNSDMIYDVFSILSKKGISREQIRVETYF